MDVYAWTKNGTNFVVFSSFLLKEDYQHLYFFLLVFFSFHFSNSITFTINRDVLIARLQQELMRLREELARVRAEDQRALAAQRDEVTRLQKILSELRLSADKSLKVRSTQSCLFIHCICSQ